MSVTSRTCTGTDQDRTTPDLAAPSKPLPGNVIEWPAKATDGIPAGSPAVDVEALTSGLCPGPPGSLWPCVHLDGIGHGGDHVPYRERFVYVDSADLQQAVCSMDELATSIGALILERERLIKERSELQSIAKVARPLLTDWPFTRGASLRRALVQRIDRAVGK